MPLSPATRPIWMRSRGLEDRLPRAHRRARTPLRTRNHLLGGRHLKRPDVRPQPACAGQEVAPEHPTSRLSRPLGQPAGARVWVLAVGALALAGAAYFSHVLTVDSFYDLYAGRYIAGHGIPRVNVLTAASHGSPWIDQQWLAHLGYYGAWAIAGYPAVATVSVLLTVAGWVLLAVMMLRRGVPPTRMFTWTTVGAVVCLADYQIQAQNFGFPLLVLTLWLLLADAGAVRPRLRTWLVIAVLAAWANLHGSVLLGVGITGLYAAQRAVAASARRDGRAVFSYCGLGLSALAAVACTPYGVGVVGYYRSLIGNSEISRYIGRWAPPDPADPVTWLFLALVAAVLIAVALAWRRGARPDPFLATVAGVTLALALIAARNQDWFALTGVLLAADAQARARDTPVPVLRRGFTVVVAGLLGTVAAASYVSLITTTRSQFESQAPVRAIAAAAALAMGHPGWHILGDPYTGTSMLWLQPAATAGRDGFDVRFEQYTERQLGEYFRFILVRGAAWYQVTRSYQVIVISRQSVRLSHALARLPGWRVVYADADGLVYRYQSPEDLASLSSS